MSVSIMMLDSRVDKCVVIHRSEEHGEMRHTVIGMADARKLGTVLAERDRAVATARALIAAYADGEESGEIDWEDVDEAHRLALQVFSK